jgi:predicted metalloenzyme YecM
MTSISEFYSGAEKFITRFNVFAEKHDLVGRAKADHICYKCDSTESFEERRALFEHESLFVYQSIISNRRIAYIGFKKGIETVLGTIMYLELSDQKIDGSQKEGFDHIEVYPTALSYEDMVHELSVTEKVVHVARPHHTTDDIDIVDGFLLRCTQGPLIEKIKEDEFV